MTTRTVDTIMDANDRASEQFPSVESAPGFRLHIFEQDGQWHVWLNTEAGDFDGLCLEVADTREEAIIAANAVVNYVCMHLQGMWT